MRLPRKTIACGVLIFQSVVSAGPCAYGACQAGCSAVVMAYHAAAGFCSHRPYKWLRNVSRCIIWILDHLVIVAKDIPSLRLSYCCCLERETSEDSGKVLMFLTARAKTCEQLASRAGEQAEGAGGLGQLKQKTLLSGFEG